MQDGDAALPAMHAGVVDAQLAHAAHVIEGTRLADEMRDARPLCLSPQRSLVAAWRSGSSRHRVIANASSSEAKPDPSRAQATPVWLVLPQPGLAPQDAAHW